jgi:hypothetical protein
MSFKYIVRIDFHSVKSNCEGATFSSNTFNLLFVYVLRVYRVCKRTMVYNFFNAILNRFFTLASL